MSLNLKIRELRKAKGLTIAQLAEKVGVSTPHMSEVERGVKNLNNHLIERISASLNVGASELIGGIVGVTPAVVDHGQEAPNGASLVPIYDVAAAAGVGMIVDDYEAIAANLAFPSNYLSHITKTHPRHLAIISVTGGSMMPTLAHDDIVMVDTTKKNTAFDGIFVVRVDGLLKVKRVRKSHEPGFVTLQSDNPTHPNEDVRIDDFEVVGRVVWMGTKAP